MKKQRVRKYLLCASCQDFSTIFSLWTFPLSNKASECKMFLIFHDLHGKDVCSLRLMDAKYLPETERERCAFHAKAEANHCVCVVSDR